MSGDDVATQCPFCGETRKKFGMSPRGQWNCFICETKGRSLVSFVAQYNGCSFKKAQALLKDIDYSVDNEVLQEFQAKGNLFESIVNILEKPETKDEHYQMPKLPTNTYHLVDNMNNPSAFPFFVYLYKRGIMLSQVYHYDIRYCIDGIITTNQGKEIPIRNSIVFVAHNKDGKPVYWNTRSIEIEPYIKSINAPAGKYQYSKNNSVWNVDSLTHNDTVVWCEGVFNAMMCDKHGYAPIATYGKKITDDQIKLVLAYSPRYHYLFLDNDAYEEQYQLAKRLISNGVDPKSIYIVNNPYSNKDANDLGRKISHTLLTQAKPYTNDDQFSNYIIKLVRS